MERNETRYEIRGMVSGRKGEPLRGARVVVWWQHMPRTAGTGGGRNAGDGASV